MDDCDDVVYDYVHCDDASDNDDVNDIVRDAIPVSYTHLTLPTNREV